MNHAYAYGQEEKGMGLNKARQTVSLLFNMPVHYVFRVDFNGFTKAVDKVGGLDILVESSFVDTKYPIPGKEDDLCGLTLETEEKDGVKIQVVKDATGSAMPLVEITDDKNPFTCRFETLTFNKGQAHMDGETSLKFVRSRHGTNGEGSDFARSARQQKVILAFREKVLSTQTLLNPKAAVELIQTFGQSIDTDIGNDQVPLFAKLAAKLDTAQIRRVVLDSDSKNAVLEVGQLQDYGGQSVLIPKGGAWTELAEYVQGEIFKQGI